MYFILALLAFVYCEEILIDAGTLPVDSIIRTAGDKPITVVIPNSKAKNNFNIAFDSSRRWVNSDVGMRDYTYNVTLLSKPLYNSDTPSEDSIQNFGSFGRFNSRGTASYCGGATIKAMKYALNQPSVNCTMYILIAHTGYTLYTIQKIPDEYYPMILRIEPTRNNYTTTVTSECRDKSTNCNYCPCPTSKGIEFDESYFYTTKRVSSSMVSSSSIFKYNSTLRFLSVGSTIEHSFVLLVMFICFVFTINV